ncbi:MAG: PilZ domain-containing protein [Boseongicola sp.]|nr:PilZ domain-containing protein [Boseongicola sp.]
MGYRARRDITNVSARVVVGKDDVLVTVRNVSANGVLLQQGFDAEPGDALTVQLRGRRFPGKVAWTSETATGVIFDTPLRPAERALFTGRASSVPTAAKTRVGFVGHAAIKR